MNNAQPPLDDNNAPPRNSRRRTAEPTTRQLIIPFLVTLFAIAALIMFIYGFCTTPIR